MGGVIQFFPAGESTLPEPGKVAPYGVYDIAADHGWVGVGISADTGAFAVQSSRRWWYRRGKQRYPNATRLTVTADRSGSNGRQVRLRQVRLWKRELQRLNDQGWLASEWFSGPVRWTEFPHHRIRAGVADFFRPPAGPAGPHGATIAAAAALLWLLVVCSGLVHAEQPFASATDQVAAYVWAAQQSDLCAVALRQAEQNYHLPPALLVSIAKAESGRPIISLTDVRACPWTIDADGNGIFLDGKAAAIAWLRQQALHHSFVDVGCMQVDLYYHPNAFTSVEEAFDPAANADYAAWLPVDLHRGEAGGSWDVAVELYHSNTPLLAAEYRDRVALIGADVLHGTLKGVPLYVRAVRQGTLRLLLGGGKLALINVHRQPARRSRHPFTTCQIEQILGPLSQRPSA